MKVILESFFQRDCRTKLYFPGMDKNVEEMVRQCILCQANTIQPSAMEPLKISPLPTEVFSELSCDCLGPLPGTEQSLCVIIDGYSRFPAVEVINSTSASAVIPVFDKLFSFVGTIPTVIRTDNGPPFNGQDWANFAKHMGFKHRRVTPL